MKEKMNQHDSFFGFSSRMEGAGNVDCVAHTSMSLFRDFPKGKLKETLIACKLSENAKPAEPS